MPAIIPKKSRIGLRLDTMPQLFALILCVLMAVLSLVEITSRMDYLVYLDGAIERAAGELNSRLEVTLAAERKTKPQESANTDKTSFIVSDPINFFSMQQSRLNYKKELLLLLMFRGASEEAFTLSGIIAEKVPLDQIISDSKSVLPARASVPDKSWEQLRFAFLPSNLLVAVLLISCGAIGALTAGLRTDDFTTFKDLCLGLGTGFICYLAIRGGKDLFVANAQMHGLSLNPFSSGLSGILAGLFSERFFKLLSSIFDTISQRLQGAFGEDAKEKKSNQAEGLPTPGLPLDDGSGLPSQTTQQGAAK